MDFIKESVLLKSLGHPVRLKIIAGLLQKRQCNVSAIARTLNLPQSTVSQHLGILKHCGVIAAEKTGTSTCYKVIHKKAVAVLSIIKGE